LGLLSELDVYLKEVRDETDPLVKKITENKFPTEKGLSFLECKQQTLLMYCTHVVFYLLLKAEGKPVKDHPVIKQLVQLRLMLEKMKPIAAKLKYQIDKLLNKNTSAAAIGLGVDVNAEDLVHKPRPDLLLPKDESTGGLKSLTEGGEKSAGLKFKANKSDTEGVYRPPKITPASFELQEKESQKKRNQKERAKDKALSNRELQEFRGEVLDLPEETDTGGGAQVERDAQDRERDEVEEELFTRFMPTKQDKKKRKQRESQTGFEDLDDFGDLSALVKKRKNSETETSLSDLRNEKKGGKKGKVKFGSQEIPSDDDDFFGGMEDAFEAYEKAHQKTQTKKKAKNRTKTEPWHLSK